MGDWRWLRPKGSHVPYNRNDMVGVVRSHVHVLQSVVTWCG